MNKTTIIPSIFVFTLILFAYSAFPYEQVIMKNDQIFLETNKPIKFNIYSFGGQIYVKLKTQSVGISLKLSINLDGKDTHTNQWIAINGVGRHTLSLISSDNVSIFLTIVIKGTDPYVSFSLLTMVMISLAWWILEEKKHNT